MQQQALTQQMLNNLKQSKRQQQLTTPHSAQDVESAHSGHTAIAMQPDSHFKLCTSASNPPMT
jgi:hypothetical protein